MAVGSRELTGWPTAVVGTDVVVPLAGGGEGRYINLDNAASTPPLRAAAEAVSSFLPWYSSVHRGAGYKSLVSTAAFEQGRQDIRRFFGVGGDQSVIFTKSTTEGLNRLARLFAARRATVIVSPMEHHANLLPWRKEGCTVRYVRCDGDGVLDLEDLRTQLTELSGEVVVALSGAYNVTGYCPPIHEIARLAHQHEAVVVVDGAQLAAHRPICLAGTRGSDRVDYFVCSAHKIYAPFGVGVLVAPSDVLASATPDLVGGGVADLVTRTGEWWTGLPGREEAGSPNVVGVVALAAALNHLEKLGMENIRRHEEELTLRLKEGLSSCPGVRVLASSSVPEHWSQVGVVSFTTPHVPHEVVAARLGYEFGIGVRTGRFCAHPAVLQLLGVSEADAQAALSRLAAGQPSDLPDALRASLGLENTAEDVEALVSALRQITNGTPSPFTYARNSETGDLQPEGWGTPWPSLVRCAGPEGDRSAEGSTRC